VDARPGQTRRQKKHETLFLVVACVDMICSWGGSDAGACRRGKSGIGRGLFAVIGGLLVAFVACGPGPWPDSWAGRRERAVGFSKRTLKWKKSGMRRWLSSPCDQLENQRYIRVQISYECM
jgi:hypothetical protein